MSILNDSRRVMRELLAEARRLKHEGIEWRRGHNDKARELEAQLDATLTPYQQELKDTRSAYFKSELNDEQLALFGQLKALKHNKDELNCLDALRWDIPADMTIEQARIAAKVLTASFIAQYDPDGMENEGSNANIMVSEDRHQFSLEVRRSIKNLELHEVAGNLDTIIPKLLSSPNYWRRRNDRGQEFTLEYTLGQREFEAARFISELSIQLAGGLNSDCKLTYIHNGVSMTPRESEQHEIKHLRRVIDGEAITPEIATGHLTLRGKAIKNVLSALGVDMHKVKELSAEMER